MKRTAVIAVFLVIFSGLLIPSRADEGMWTLNNLPVKQIQERYGFTVTNEWVRHIQLSSARLPNCSSSFVSYDGLVMTNGHCAEESVQALSTPKNNLYEKGFYAKTYAEELKTDRTLKVLLEIDKASTASGAVSNDYLMKIIEELRKKNQGATNLSCETVSFYQGAQHEIYCYKIYNDVRLVFSSEKNTWFFGGDADNFEYPRYAMDVAFFRVYENGRPAKTPEHFRWSRNGAKEGELIFVSGHPGRTQRLLTSKAFKTERDVRVPFLLDLFRRRELTLQQFMLRGKEQKRIAESDLFSWQNSRKLYVGKIRGLQDPKLVGNKEAFERKFYSDFSTNAALCNKFANGLILTGEAQETIRKDYARYMLLVRGLGFDSRLFGYAMSLVSGNQAYAESALSAREKEPPINREYEEAKLNDSLSHMTEVFGADDPAMSEILLKWKTGPSLLAHILAYGELSDIDRHRALVQGGAEAVRNSPDPMIWMARTVRVLGEKYAREWNEAAEKERQGYALVSEALFQGYGTDVYPDATFTLRLSFGTVSGYGENGRMIPPFTTIGGAYKHSAEFDNKGDYKLPGRWLLRKKQVNLKTPLDFVSNLDITGGNSGSPVFNKDLEIVGLVFDSNIQGLASDYDFNYDSSARAVAVHSAGIIEILKKIYRADRLVQELTR